MAQPDALFPEARSTRRDVEAQMESDASREARTTEPSLELGNQRSRTTILKTAGVLLSGVWLTLLPSQACAHGEVHEVIASVTQQISATPNNAALYLQRAELYRVDADW